MWEEIGRHTTESLPAGTSASVDGRTGAALATSFVGRHSKVVATLKWKEINISHQQALAYDTYLTSYMY